VGGPRGRHLVRNAANLPKNGKGRENEKPEKWRNFNSQRGSVKKKEGYYFKRKTVDYK